MKWMLEAAKNPIVNGCARVADPTVMAFQGVLAENSM
jgi:hypothetical protein